MDTTESKNLEPKRWFTLNRVLLLGIIVLQIAILTELYRNHELRKTELPPFPKQQEVTRHSPSMTSTGHRAAVRPTPIANPAPARNPFDDGSAGPALWRGPGDEAQEMHEEISRMMQRMSSRFVEMESLLDFDRGWNALMMSPTMDMRDHGDSYVLDFSLPGMDASKIEISLEGRLLTVNTSVEEQGSAARRFGRFERKVLLPGPVGDASSARAMMTNGVLKVIIPKAGEPKAEVKPGRIFPSERFDNRGHSIPGNTY